MRGTTHLGLAAAVCTTVSFLFGINNENVPVMAVNGVTLVFVLIILSIKVKYR